MSRSNYNEDGDDQWQFIRWRGAVKAAIKGSRGQALLKDMLVALEEMPERELIANDLERDGKVCALGAVGKARGIDMSGLDPEDAERVAAVFGVSPALVREITYMNDEYEYTAEASDARFGRMRDWVASLIRAPARS